MAGLRLHSITMAVALLVSVSAAHAQSREELRQARAQFAEGVELMDAEQYAEAVERFRAVMQVSTSAQVRYNLALALEHIGELVEAASLLRDLVDERALPRRTRRDAQELLDLVEPRLARITIDAVVEADSVVRLDGQVVDFDQIGSPLIVNPGPHEIVLNQDGRNVATRRVRVAEGASTEVELRAPRLPAPQLPPSTQQPTGTSSNVAEQWWFWAVVGAAAIVLIGIIAGVATSS
jgi:hypothetical protein